MRTGGGWGVEVAEVAEVTELEEWAVVYEVAVVAKLRRSG